MSSHHVYAHDPRKLANRCGLRDESIQVVVADKIRAMNLRVLTQKHACDGCTVCCEAIAVHELGKPFYTRCEHQIERGCNSYDQRPQSCRDFLCSWAAGFLGEDPARRPDKSGVLFFLRRYPDGLWLEIFETAFGAIADASRTEYLAQRIIARVEKTEPVGGIRIHRFGDAVAVGFDVDRAKYPAAPDVSRKHSKYGWINGDPRRQIFIEAHDAP